MSVDWIFYYPHPDSPHDVVVTTANPYSGRIDHLWALAQTEAPSLARHVGRERCMFYIVRSSFCYTTGSFSHFYPSRPTYLWSHTPPYFLAAEIGFASTVMMAKGS